MVRFDPVLEAWQNLVSSILFLQDLFIIISYSYLHVYALLRLYLYFCVQVHRVLSFL